MTIGYVAVHCDTGRERHVFDHLTQLPHIKEVTIVLGLYDIICKLETSNAKELENDVLKIRKISHVQTTMTLIVF